MGWRSATRENNGVLYSLFPTEGDKGGDVVMAGSRSWCLCRSRCVAVNRSRFRPVSVSCVGRRRGVGRQVLSIVVDVSETSSVNRVRNLRHVLMSLRALSFVGRRTSRRSSVISFCLVGRVSLVLGRGRQFSGRRGVCRSSVVRSCRRSSGVGRVWSVVVFRR